MIVIQIHKVNFQIGPWFFKFVDYLPYNLFPSSIWMVLSHWFVMTSYDNNLSLLLFSENNNSRIIIEVSTHTDTIVNNSDIMSKQQIFIELWKPFVNLRSSEKRIPDRRFTIGQVRRPKCCLSFADRMDPKP